MYRIVLNVSLNLTFLFLKLLAVAQRNEDVSRCVSYELTAEHSSLFKKGLQHKPKNPELRKALTDHIVDILQQADQFVLDGGALLKNSVGLME